MKYALLADEKIIAICEDKVLAQRLRGILSYGNHSINPWYGLFIIIIEPLDNLEADKVNEFFRMTKILALKAQ